MKALIFGGTGFIGRNLCNELLSAGYRVSIVSRNPQKAGLSGSGAEAVAWSVSAGALPVELLDGVTLIINLAGESIGNRRWTQPVKEEILNSRVQITQAIVNAIKQQRFIPRVLINASAIGFYGPRGDAEITESTPAGHDFLAKVCQAWEEEALKAQTSGVRVVVVRIGVVIGDAGALARMKAPFRFYVGGPLGTGAQWMSWIHVKDLTRLIRFAAENENMNGPVNATAPELVRMKDFCNTLGQVMGRPSWLRVPGFLLKVVLGEMSNILLNSQRVLPDKILKEGFLFRFPVLKNALEDIIQQ
ncbi:Epimerase family protein [Pelotomaculum sp. FP]|uniref:TIGR01777 family oxidoreductase n=1 Tax=Pelotomaculum sp. FP TaxID=261474 RepID=UPI0010668C67|nr:TIGR01777 family oxidoreductase [Pelotomaculum sp. FP]TEB16676.1 Epimerase family protein [Pelotomaculum sp. FP]